MPSLMRPNSQAISDLVPQGQRDDFGNTLVICEKGLRLSQTKDLGTGGREGEDLGHEIRWICRLRILALPFTSW